MTRATASRSSSSMREAPGYSASRIARVTVLACLSARCHTTYGNPTPRGLVHRDRVRQRLPRVVTVHRRRATLREHAKDVLELRLVRHHVRLDLDRPRTVEGERAADDSGSALR